MHSITARFAPCGSKPSFTAGVIFGNPSLSEGTSDCSSFLASPASDAAVGEFVPSESFETLLALLGPSIGLSVDVEECGFFKHRLENVKIKRLHTQAKIVGTTSTIGGAMIMTLVKGPTMVLPWTKHSKNIVSYSAQHVVNQHTDYIKAALLLTACCCCISCSRIGQAIMLKSYPAALSLIALICMAGTVQSTIFTLILERGNASVWSLHWDMRLFTYVYHGLLRSGTEYYISVIVMKVKGPVFVTSFNPLCMVIVAIVGSFLLSEKLYLGRVLGAVVIVVGLGLVLWGKSKDQTSSDNDHNHASNST
nr:WAT1-related protein At2g39510-like [Ipomoea batatas]